tara:strand:+ start:4237 stop:4851 length:615 start_codon:yes stop_codon:yes gene_type:complete
MSQKSGLHRILEVPIFYNFIQKLFSHKKTRLRWNQLIEENSNGIILDVGCGPGNQSLHFKNSKEYIGLDISDAYINKAKQLHRGFGQFHVMSATEIDKLTRLDFDLIILNGVFHHLSDDEVSEFLKKVSFKMSKNGVVVTSDAIFIKGRYIANFIMSHDRGLHVRTPSELIAIVEKYLKIIEYDIVRKNFPPYQRIMMKLGTQV